MNQKLLTTGSTIDLPSGSTFDLQISKTALSETITTPVYCQRFWRPFLGGMAYDLWLILRDYAQEAEKTKESPSIELLVDTLGHGSRHTILGRKKSGNHPAQKGLLSQLAEVGIIHHDRVEWGGAVRHVFHVIDQLPLLTESQVLTLSGRKQDEHSAYIRRFKKHF